MVRPLPSERPSVLLVEDDDGVRRATQLLLHGHGYSVRAHRTAASALADPSGAETEYLLADYRLPDGDGIGLLQAMRATGWEGHAVLMTGHPHTGLEDAALQGGYAVFLEKPLRSLDLLGALTGSDRDAPPA